MLIVPMLSHARSYDYYEPDTLGGIDADFFPRSVDIDHDFTGLEILMYGARTDVGRVVVMLRGPEHDYIVRRKERVAGVWVNKESVIFHNVPSLYHMASTSDLKEIRNDRLLDALDIGLANIPFYPEGHDLAEVEAFKQAIISHKQAQGLYSTEIEDIDFWSETLFRTWLTIPKNISGGTYSAEAYLFSDVLSASQYTPIHAKKTGFAAFMFDLAHHYSFLYGLMAVAMALICGWVASSLFGRS